jgi:hypothetical protein
MLVKDFTKKVEETYNRYLPASKCFARLSTNLHPSISISCFLANDKTELYNRYWENDMMNIRFSIDTEKGEFPKDIMNDSEIPNNLQLTIWSKSYLLKPLKSNMCYDGKQLPFRKTKGDSQKIINTLDKYFLKLHAELLQDLKNNLIHDNHKNLLISKLAITETRQTA